MTIKISCDRCRRELEAGQGGMFRLYCDECTIINPKKTHLERTSMSKGLELDVLLCGGCYDIVKTETLKPVP